VNSLRRWFRFPKRIDVVLAPRDWSFSTYPRGIIVKVTGHYDYDGSGRIVRDAIRLGPALRSEG
jgi:hypothetical protein